jgi:phenylpropionate dioxygenase-like ring-hydroxylating dioxygenase large terminal subunit
MLTREENELLTRTGPGTLMGNLIRRFWLPALVPSELPEPDCPPIRFRIASEDLVAFRDSDGKVGFFAQACPHRGASLFFGRNEESGLRCVYHGWKFDVSGACVDMPSEPAESNFKNKVRVKSYPSAEYGGLVWIYMGPAEKQPPLPQFDWCLHADEHPDLKVYKWLQECNYTQGVESFLDTVHINFLHRSFTRQTVGGRPVDRNAAPSLEIEETDFGFVYGGRRPTLDGRYYWRITAHIQPWFSEIPSTTWDGSGSFVVPQDDEHSWWFTVSPPGRRAAAGAPEREHVELIPGTFRQTNNKDNDYLIDREKQRTVNYTGLAGNRVEDAMVTESMGPIMDRTHEHLGTTDRAIIFWRRQLLRWARDLENGLEPPILKDASVFRARPIDIITDEPEMLPIWNADRVNHLAEPVAPLIITS